MKKKRGLIKLGVSAILAITTILSLVACGGQQTNGGPTPDKSAPPSNANSGEVMTVKLGHNLKEDSSDGKAMVEFKKKLEELSNGKIMVEVYPNQQLGSMREIAEQTQFGSIQMALQGASVISAFAPSMKVLDMPFLFPNDPAMWSALQGEPGKELLATLDTSGFKGLSFFHHGFRQFTSKDFPIESPEDLQGVKFRSMPSDLLIDTYKAWGANPTPIDFAELYNALQQGVVAAQDNPLETIDEKKLYEVQKNLTISNHSYLAYMLVANKAWYDALSDDLKKAVDEAAVHAANYGHDLTLKQEEEFIKKLKDQNMTVTELSEEGRKKFEEASKPVYEKYIKDEKDKEIFNKIKAMANQ